MHFKIVVCFAGAFAFLQQTATQNATESRAGEVWEMGQGSQGCSGAGWVFVRMEYSHSGGVAEFNPSVAPFMLSPCFPLALVQLGAQTLLWNRSLTLLDPSKQICIEI